MRKAAFGFATTAVHTGWVSWGYHTAANAARQKQALLPVSSEVRHFYLATKQPLERLLEIVTGARSGALQLSRCKPSTVNSFCSLLQADTPEQTRSPTSLPSWLNSVCANDSRACNTQCLDRTSWMATPPGVAHSANSTEHTAACIIHTQPQYVVCKL